jgi:signal transduction histidine kinase
MTIAADTNNDTSNERIEVLRNNEIILSRYLQALRNANKWDYFAETKSFSLVPLAIESLGEALIAAEKRGMKLRLITEITKDNISSCRNTMKIAELKHLEGVHGNFAVSDTEYIAINTVIGLSTYSNSRPGVLSYVSIFENLWMEAELYKQVKEANERLTLHDKMQQEFINVAAHELRTPIQPILTMVGLLHSTKGHVSSQQMDDSLEMIRRNAQRLKRLAEDILDVTKIETQSLILHKEQLNLNDIVVSAIGDVKNQIQYNSVSGGGVQILYESKGDDTIFIEAHRYRIAQLVTNLLSNAIKFVKQYDGLVYISIEKKEDVVGGGQEVALVSVRDNGSGIDADIFPRLFEKFASKSFKGTGLGLFICKSIVEAHGGRIWAENRVIAGENGATFHFTLPILLR